MQKGKNKTYPFQKHAIEKKKKTKYLYAGDVKRGHDYCLKPG